jgi:plasmid stabilization system protein ParE
MLRYKVTFSKRANLNIDQAMVWYENQKTDLGLEFYEEILFANKLYLANNPKLSVTVYEDYRQFYLKRFPYSLIYRIDEDKQEVQIVTVIHNKQLSKHDYDNFE